MRYFIVFYKYSVDYINQNGDSVFSLKQEAYPNMFKVAMEIRDIVSKVEGCNKSRVSFGVYCIQELSEQDFKDFNSLSPCTTLSTPK